MHERQPEPAALGGPALWPTLAPVLASWPLFGAPCAISGGGMTSPTLADHRAALFPARRQWLDEQGIEGEDRGLFFRLWGALDVAEIQYQVEVLEETMSRR